MVTIKNLDRLQRAKLVGGIVLIAAGFVMLGAGRLAVDRTILQELASLPPCSGFKSHELGQEVKDTTMLYGGLVMLFFMAGLYCLLKMYALHHFGLRILRLAAALAGGFVLSLLCEVLAMTMDHTYLNVVRERKLHGTSYEYYSGYLLYVPEGMSAAEFFHGSSDC